MLLKQIWGEKLVFVTNQLRISIVRLSVAVTLLMSQGWTVLTSSDYGLFLKWSSVIVATPEIQQSLQDSRLVPRFTSTF